MAEWRGGTRREQRWPRAEGHRLSWTGRPWEAFPCAAGPPRAGAWGSPGTVCGPWGHWAPALCHGGRPLPGFGRQEPVRPWRGAQLVGVSSLTRNSCGFDCQQGPTGAADQCFPLTPMSPPPESKHNANTSPWAPPCDSGRPSPGGGKEREFNLLATQVEAVAGRPAPGKGLPEPGPDCGSCSETPAPSLGGVNPGVPRLFCELVSKVREGPH